MSQTRRLIRQTMTIARRDFVATVFTPIFLLFLFAPLIMVAFSTIGAMGAAQAADHGTDRVRIVAIVSDATATAFAAAGGLRAGGDMLLNRARPDHIARHARSAVNNGDGLAVGRILHHQIGQARAFLIDARFRAGENGTVDKAAQEAAHATGQACGEGTGAGGHRRTGRCR